MICDPETTDGVNYAGLAAIHLRPPPSRPPCQRIGKARGLSRFRGQIGPPIRPRSSPLSRTVRGDSSATQLSHVPK
jgi:hypothetical protein